MRKGWLLFAVVVSGCGVPESKYAAAVKDADDAHAALKKKDDENQALQKRADNLDAEVKRLNEAMATAQAAADARVSQSEQDRAQLEELRRAKAQAEATARLFKDFISKFKRMVDAGKLKIVTRHGRLVLQLHNDVLFDAFKTNIKPAGRQALIEIAQTLKTVPGRRFQVAGHTDVVPVHTKNFPTNWDLSSARAIEVVKVLVTAGVSPAVLSAAGYSMYDPLGHDSAHNRRTEITLVPNIEELIALPELSHLN